MKLHRACTNMRRLTLHQIKWWPMSLTRRHRRKGYVTSGQELIAELPVTAASGKSLLSVRWRAVYLETAGSRGLINQFAAGTMPIAAVETL